MKALKTWERTQPLGELAGALLVGRFEDGTPVTFQGADGLDDPVPNNFDYRGDMAGARCPFFAHIRKTNPRGDIARTLVPAPQGQTDFQQISGCMPMNGA